MLLGCRLLPSHQLVDGETDVPTDLSQKGWRNVPASVEGNRGASAINMPKLLMRSALTNRSESETLE